MHLVTSRRTFARCTAALVVLSILIAPLPSASQPGDSVSVIRGTERSTVGVPSDGVAPPVPPAPPRSIAQVESADPKGPESWLAVFESTYESGDSVAYAALLTGDYRFVAGDPDVAREYPDGFTREDELISYARMFRGAVSRDGRVLPRARTVDVALLEVHVMEDPSFPGDPDHALVHVVQATIAIAFDDGSGMRDTAPHAFWLVRPAGDGAWQCRRWVERPAASVLAAVDVPAGGGTAAVAAAASGPVGVPYPNPSREGAGIAYAYEVLGDGDRVELALFDVRGRRVATMEQAVKSAGRHTARWNGRNDDGARVAAGVYFLQASVGTRMSQHRLIIMR